MIDQELLKESESNSTFDLKALEKTLDFIRKNSFNYLYQVQKDVIGYKRFDFKMTDLKKMSTDIKGKNYPKKYVAFIDENFIGEHQRLLYKKSQFINKEMSLFDVANNPKIFSHIYMVFVDGKFFDTVNILCKEDKTYIIFDIQENNINPTGIPNSYFRELVNKNADITVFFVPNCAYGIYNTNIHVLQKYKNELALSRFNIANNLQDPSKYITFINDNDLLFESVITDTVNSSELLKFYDNDLNDFKSKYVHLNIFGFRNLFDQIDITGDTKFISIPRQEAPIPVENIMIFRNINGKKKFAHDIQLKLYYPNIYEVLNNNTNDNLTLYVFYFDDTESVGLHYTDDLELYHRLLGTDLKPYIDGTIHDIVKNYNPYTFEYNLKDFESSQFHPDHLKYKIEKMRGWIEQNPEILREYLRNQIDKPEGYYIDVSKIDLGAKYRENNFNEVDSESQRKVFDEPRYVFILRNEDNTPEQRLRFFIDGILYVPDELYRDDSYEYYYIPTSIVKIDSVIEIEKFDEFSYQSTVTFSSINEKKLITTPLIKSFNPTNVFLVDPTTNEYIPRNKYIITINTVINDIELSNSSFKKINKNFHISITDTNLVNKPLNVFVKKEFFFEKKLIETDKDLAEIFFFPSVLNDDASHIRLFRNGRLLPESLYKVEFDNVMDGQNVLVPIIKKEVGDEFVLDYTPYRYKVVYRQTSIDPSGLVNVLGNVDKPIDLKWHDIYVNGRKLNLKNIELISPSLFIIKGIESLKNLVIIEKDRDEEFFTLGSNPSINDILMDSIPELKEKFLEGRPLIEDNEVDIITEIIDAITIELILFFRVGIWNKFINPDLPQITDTLRQKFPNIVGDKPIVMINPDENPEAEIKMDIYPETF